MYAELGSPAISLAGNIINNNIQDRRDREAREWQEKMVNEANAFNSPVAQMQRLKQAGINPNLVAGVHPSSSAAAPNVSTGSRPETLDTVAQSLLQALQLESSIEVNKAQADALKASSHKTDVESDLLIRNEGRNQDDFLYNKGLRQVREQRDENAEQRAQNADRRAEEENDRAADNFDFERSLREARRRVSAADAEAAEAHAHISSARSSRIEEIIQSELDSAKQSRNESRARADNLTASKELTESQKKELDDTLEMLEQLKNERLEYFRQQLKDGKELSKAQLLAAQENTFAIAAKSKYLRDHYMKYDKRTKTWYVPEWHKTDFEKAVFGTNWLTDLAVAQNIYEKD